jgi:hypothetical protein
MKLLFWVSFPWICEIGAGLDRFGSTCISQCNYRFSNNKW